FGLTQPAVRRPADSGEAAAALAYTAPERVRGAPSTAASDNYSLAAVLSECLRPSAPANGAPLAGLPSRVEKLMQGALAPEPERRPGSAGGLVRKVEAALEGRRAPRGRRVKRPAPAAPPVRPAPAAPRAARR